MQITRHESEHKRVSILPFHPLADMFPPMTEAEFSDLVADIDKHSLRQEIDTWQGMILEGRHRALACQQLGIEPKYHERWFSDDDGARAYVISQNIHRRHLTVEQKRDVIAALLKANPSKSDLTIAKQAMTHHHAVANVRLEEEGRGNISHVEKRTDSKGRKQPAKEAEGGQGCGRAQIRATV